MGKAAPSKTERLKAIPVADNITLGELLGAVLKVKPPKPKKPAKPRKKKK